MYRGSREAAKRNSIEPAEKESKIYVARLKKTDLVPFLIDPLGDFAEVAIRVEPKDGSSEVTFSPAALESLKQDFGEDFEHVRQCAWSGALVTLQMHEMDDDRQLAHGFRGEIVRITVSRHAGKEPSGILVGSASMQAALEFLNDFDSKKAIN